MNTRLACLARAQWRWSPATEQQPSAGTLRSARPRHTPAPQAAAPVAGLPLNRWARCSHLCSRTGGLTPATLPPGRGESRPLRQLARLPTPAQAARTKAAASDATSPCVHCPSVLLRLRSFLSWDDYFMSLAFLSAERSKDPNKQVGSEP
jgi:hypothetical protein